MADVLLPVGGVPSDMGPGAPGRPRDMYFFENPTAYAGVEKTGVDAEVSRGVGNGGRTRLQHPL